MGPSAIHKELYFKSGIHCKQTTIDANHKCSFLRKQDCIPVGCVPPTRNRMGVSLTENPLDRDLPQ